MPYWRVLTLAVEIAAADEAADTVRELLGKEPVQLERPGASHVWLEIYFEAHEDVQAAEQHLKARVPVAAVAVRRCDSRDWQDFWKLHFKPHKVGRRLWITPAWDESAVEDEQICLRIVPGLSFGTGEHFTTRFCLEQIERMAPPVGSCRTMWDVGCGSGILAVAGALLGMDRVWGTDNDPVCLVQAAENAALNDVAEQADWGEADLADGTLTSSQDVDLVCANIYASLLMEAAGTLWAAANRYLVVSGVREQEVDAVADRFRQLGAREVVRDGDGEWAGLTFTRQ